MASVETRLASLEAGDGGDAAEYDNVLAEIMSTANNLENNMVRYVQIITSENTGVIQSRRLLSNFIQQFRALTSNDAKTEAG